MILRGKGARALLASFVVCAGVGAAVPATETGLPTTIYEEWRLTASPSGGVVVSGNPPSLLWAPVRHWEGRDVTYVVEISDRETFPKDRTRRSEPQRACFYNLHARLAPGTWYWRYEIKDGSRVDVKGPFAFRVAESTPVFESPTFEAFLSRVPRTHPRVVTLGRDLVQVRERARQHPLTAEVRRRGTQALLAELYAGPVDDKDPATTRALHRRASQEIKVFHQLLDAQILSPSPDLMAALARRMEVLLSWPTDDLIGSQVLTALARAYDALEGELPASLKGRMLAVVDKQLRHGLAAWPGRIEGRQVENHFWQMELAGNFTAALATVHELEASRAMLAYTYGLFLARFPNLAARDGGWSEGLGYFGVNESAVIDMAVLMKRVGGFDVFQMEWYRSLAEYFLYFAPLGGHIDGFGDMHDRVGASETGQSMMLVLGHETGDPLALDRAARIEERARASVEEWYRIIEGVQFSPAQIPRPAVTRQDRVFAGVGLAAFHTDVLESSRDLALYFRSSPFGAKGHMHANQNAFNLSRRGEPVFYSTGYYTSFADAHSLTSYRHTRAHNSILVNGCGQAFGHEGYGWIKRSLAGQDLSYVCGDATMAYRQTVDQQFLGLLKSAGIEPTQQNGHGDSGLRRFERHLLLVRPDKVVVYDVLEAEQPSAWTLLLHSLQPAQLSGSTADVKTSRNHARATVLGSGTVRSEVTDQFFRPPVDTLRKYRETPNQYHLSWTSGNPSRGMRFLTVIQLGDAEATLPSLVALPGGRWQVDDCVVTAELDADRPPKLAVETRNSAVYVNDWPTASRGMKLPAASSRASVLVEPRAGQAVVSLAEDALPFR